MNKKLYQTAGEKKEKKPVLDTQAGETIPKDQVWENGKIVKIIKTGAKTQRVVIGVYYVDDNGKKVKGLKPVKGTVPRKRQTGGLRYQEGGPKMYQQAGVNAMQNTRPIAYGKVGAGLGYYSAGSPSRRQAGGVRPFDVGGMEVQFSDSKGNPINPAGSTINGDMQKIYTDRSADNLSSSDTLYYNQGSGDISYYDPEIETKSLMHRGYSQARNILGGGNYPQASKPYLGMSQKKTGGMYENTVSAAGQGGPQLGVSSTIVGQETDPAIQQARIQGLQQSTSAMGEEAQGLISQTRQQESIDQQQAEVEAMKAEQQSQQQASALEGIAGQTAQTIGQNLYPNQGGGLGSAVKTAQGVAQGVKLANQASKAANIAKDAGEFYKVSNAAGQTMGGFGAVGGSAVQGTGSAVGAGLKSFATSGAGIGTIANLAGRGISALSDDDDPTKSNFGEYSGQILQSAGTGATIGSFFPGPGTAIGAAIGAGIGAGKQYFGTKKAKKAQNKYEGEARVRRNKGIRELNKRVGSLYGSHMSGVRAGNLAQKTVSGQNLGRNVMYKHGGLMMGMPRYGYNS